MNAKIQSFTDLTVWQKAHELVLMIYSSTEGFPKQEMFGLVSQMRRSAVSITSNIAEGFSRHSKKEKLQFYSVAHGSLTELENQLFVARDVRYLNSDAFTVLNNQIQIVHRLLNAFLRSTRNFS